MVDKQKVRITKNMMRFLERAKDRKVEAARLKWKEPNFEKNPQRNEAQ